ncbi:MAG TPA: hypothetical protein VFC46_08370 [Humisphaera sp.]|nr:hypothetical protein [Humisphaera sp.]
MSPAWDEVIDLLARGTTPAEVVAFRPSAAALQRIHDLLGRLKDETLTPEESKEMDQYLLLEYVMSLAKARARENVTKMPHDAV